jgi:hypothetical protein
MALRHGAAPSARIGIKERPSGETLGVRPAACSIVATTSRLLTSWLRVSRAGIPLHDERDPDRWFVHGILAGEPMLAKHKTIV